MKMPALVGALLLASLATLAAQQPMLSAKDVNLVVVERTSFESVDLAVAAPAFAQQCLHEAGETPEQLARKRAALTATRNINNIQFNRPEAGSKIFLRHEDLATAPFAARMKDSKDPVVPQISLASDADIVPGWRLTLDVTANGYWFSVKDTTDPCGFSYISNHSGLIYTAQPLR